MIELRSCCCGARLWKASGRLNEPWRCGVCERPELAPVQVEIPDRDSREV